MTDKKEKDKNNNERSDEINVSKCKYFNNGWCLLSESCDAIKYRPCGDMTLIDCYYRNWQRKEQECKKLKKELEAVYDDCKGCPACNEALYNANLYAKEYRKLKQTLAEIKEIADPYKMTIKKICGNCKKYDDDYACCYKDINRYKYTSPKTNVCEEFTYLDKFVPNILAKQIIQKISESEE